MKTHATVETFRAGETFFSSSVFDNKQTLDDLLQECHEKKANPETLFFLLVSHFGKLGIRNYIINHLFEMQISKLLFYLPQFCYMNMMIPKTFLEKFLVMGCSKSTEFFILVSSLGVLADRGLWRGPHHQESDDGQVRAGPDD
jgi:hypothetical protein